MKLDTLVSIPPLEAETKEEFKTEKCAALLKSEVYFNETAALPCQFPNSQNLSLNELVIFWQYREKLVLYELYLGRENLHNVAAEYMHRTSFDQSSWTLRLHRAQIKDKGPYQCIIHHKKPTGLVSIHQKDSELSVFANFTEPEIVQMSNVTGNSGINLTCSSGQGYPKATKMYFLLKLENSTELEYDGIMQISQDNDTGLYNISISSYVPFPDAISNVTIFCVLKTQSMKLSSKPFYKDEDREESDSPNIKNSHDQNSGPQPSVPDAFRPNVLLHSSFQLKELESKHQHSVSRVFGADRPDATTFDCIT
ncbi:T-lymphocyte activation antigen CD86 [Fukomys damarensis]|uniref:T-lymphocyte activation antigen CD86 n=1 Tax=Fukomys damarensis TaxID=885580 RepID=A0A091E6J5_FUKDA|nr:T-lymphocyte activation antigen CD86 [Fukomys damarensis]